MYSTAWLSSAETTAVIEVQSERSAWGGWANYSGTAPSIRTAAIVR